MARLKRICLPGISHHIIQRGNNRQNCFCKDEDYAAYAYWLNEYARKHQVDVHAWVFMTNHVHLLATPMTSDGISKMMQALGRNYVSYFNYTYNRTGTLWEGRFKSCVIDSDHYLFICQRYIEMNPVRAGMVEKPEDYKWTSFHSNALAKKTTLWTPHPLYESLGGSNTERAYRYRAMFDWKIEPDTLTNIRQSLNQGMVMGNKKFKHKIERLSGRRASLLPRGPAPK